MWVPEVSGQEFTQLGALGTEVAPRWPGVLDASPGRLVMFMPARRYTHPALVAGVSIGTGYLVLAAYLLSVIGLNQYLLSGLVAGGLALAYIVGYVGDAVFNNAFIRATVRHPKVVLSIDLLSTNGQRIHAWYKFPIRVAGEGSYSREASHLWIHGLKARRIAYGGIEERSCTRGSS